MSILNPDLFPQTTDKLQSAITKLRNTLPIFLKRLGHVVAALVGYSAYAVLATAQAPQITSATSANGSLGSVMFYQTTIANEQFTALDPTNTFLLNTASNQPQFCAGEDGWALIEELSNADVETYLSDRASRGYNCIWITLADNIYQTNPPHDYYGNSPFDGPDFTNEDPTYWSHVDYVLSRMMAYGITAFASPAFVGNSPSGGYFNSYQSSSDATLIAYGTWLANRYIGYPNIVWTLGGDTLPAFFSKVADIATGIRSVDTVHLITMEGTPQGDSSATESSSGYAYCTPTCASWLNVNWSYNQYQSVQFGCSYNTATYPLPNLLGETWYEGEHSTSELEVREEGYWGILSGCTLGNLFGNNAIWTMGGPSDTMGATWESQLSSVGSVDQAWEGALFRSREFWKMLPDPSNTYLTGGYGSGTTISVLSRTSDGQTMIAYIPNGIQTAVTINMAGIISSTNTARGWWFNPQTGVTSNLGTFSNSKNQNFTPPDSNDWVLVLDDNSVGLQAPATTVMTTGPQLLTYAATGLPSGLSVNSLTGLISGTPTEAGTFGVALSATNSAGTGTATLTLTITGTGQTTPVITWRNPAAIDYGTALSATQLDASTTVAGTFTYTPVAGSVLPAGTNTLSVVFTPTDTADYTTATATAQLKVDIASQTITFATPPSQTFGTPLTLSATASSGLTVSYASTTPTICTVSGSTMTFVAGAAGCNIQATQAGNSNYSAAPAILRSFWVYKEAQTINFAAIPSQTVGTPLALSATATSGLAVTFTSATTGVCTVSGTTATFVAAGTCTIDAHQAGNGGYLAAAVVAQSFAVTKASQTITFATPANQTYGIPLTLSATASSGLAVSYASTTPTICTVSGSTVSFLSGAEGCSIQATQAGNSNYSAAPAILRSFWVYKGAQTINFATPPAQTYGTPYTLSATASSGLAITFISTTTSICTVSGTTATFIATGTCTIDAHQAGNGDYLAATAVVQSFTVDQKAQTITFATPPSQTYGTPLTLSATASSGLAVSYASTTTSVCTVSGSTVSFVAGGAACSIQATQAGNSNYSAAPAITRSFWVYKEAQTITFAAIPSQKIGTPLALSATASSGLPVTFISATTGHCTVSGTTATFVTAGTCTIDAHQAGNGGYLAATVVAQSFSVTKAAQTITFATPANQTYGTPLTLSATASSGLAVSYASTTTSVCTVSGSTVTFVAGAAGCSIQATQAGNSSYNAAPAILRSFWVYKDAQAINFPTIPSQTVGTPLALSATASSGLAVTFTSTTTSICTVSGTTATFVATGTCTIDAHQAGNSDYLAATVVAQSFKVNAN
jgi:hypothetical protein